MERPVLIERWLEVPGYKGVYEVSNYGFVRLAKTGHVLKFDFNRPRYLRVALYKNGERKRYLIHRLVLRVFKPHRNWRVMEGGHDDGNKRNNREDNLSWQTKSKNQHHRHHVLGKNNWKPINEKIMVTKENMKVEDNHGFHYEVEVEVRPQQGLATAYYNGAVIDVVQYSSFREPDSDFDHEWEAYEEKVAMFTNDAMTDLRPTCEVYFNNKTKTKALC